MEKELDPSLDSTILASYTSPGVIAYNILKVPLFYTLSVSVLTFLLKNQITIWFEHVLYIEEED
jgi:hypothetical protein